MLADLFFQHGAQFGNDFSFRFLFTSYLGGDVLLAALVQLFGVNGAAAIWAVLTFISLPAAVYFYLRVMEARIEVVLLMLFVSLFLTSDTFFVMGFFEFKLSIALALVGLATLELLRQRWSAPYFAIFAVLILVTYLVHLAAVVFIGALQGVSAVWRIAQRRSSLARELLLFAPVIGVLAWHFVGAAAYRQADDLVDSPDSWGTVARKMYDLSWDLRRYDRRQDTVVIGTLLIFLAASMLNRRVEYGKEWLSARVLEPLSYALVFFGLYFVLPFSQLEATYIDARALVLALLFLFLGLLSIRTAIEPSSSSGGRGRTDAITISFAALAVYVNLAYLTFHLWKDSEWLAQYRATLAPIPPHASVLPIYTDATTRRPLEHLHAASFAVIDREALIPYQFSGDRGNPMKYFRYVRRPYAPPELWYRQRQDNEVDWQQIARQYRYLLVMKPFTADRIPIQTRTVAETDAAVLMTTR